MTLSTRLGVMTAGEIMQVGTPHDVYEYPQSRFVADFIGSVNLFEGRIAGDFEDHATIHSPDTGSEILVSHGISGVKGQPVAVALRPEKIAIERRLPETVANRLRARVEDVSYMGNLSVFHVTLPTGKPVKVSQTNRLRSDDDAIRAGEEVEIGWDGAASVVVSA